MTSDRSLFVSLPISHFKRSIENHSFVLPAIRVLSINKDAFELLAGPGNGRALDVNCSKNTKSVQRAVYTCKCYASQCD